MNRPYYPLREHAKLALMEISLACRGIDSLIDDTIDDNQISLVRLYSFELGLARMQESLKIAKDETAIAMGLITDTDNSNQCCDDSQ